MAHQNGRLCPEASMECDTLTHRCGQTRGSLASLRTCKSSSPEQRAPIPARNALGSASVIPMRRSVRIERGAGGVGLCVVMYVRDRLALLVMSTAIS